MFYHIEILLFRDGHDEKPQTFTLWDEDKDTGPALAHLPQPGHATINRRSSIFQNPSSASFPCKRNYRDDTPLPIGDDCFGKPARAPCRSRRKARIGPGSNFGPKLGPIGDYGSIPGSRPTSAIPNFSAPEEMRQTDQREFRDLPVDRSGTSPRAIQGGAGNGPMSTSPFVADQAPQTTKDREPGRGSQDIARQMIAPGRIAAGTQPGHRFSAG